MAQKTDLNVNPYFDDFDVDKNFYKVLFKPGIPVQTRELINLQSILQNQVESFGSHIFKEGSLVIPGSISYDSQYFAVKLNPNFSNIDIRAYINQYLDKKIEGLTSGVTAIVQRVEIPDSINNIDYVTLYVKYIDADNENTISSFSDGESLTCDENIIYGNNTVINSGSPFASLISIDACSTGSSVSITDGIYFVRGIFAKIFKQTIILDYYTNTPSYRVGIKISEEIITAKDDPSLYDNAKGFNNYSAPGADRFKLNLSLAKKSIDSVETDVDFIEILRIDNGEIKKVSTQTQYSVIKDYLAQRTYDESGNYSVEPFKISIHNSLNDNLGNDGLFLPSQSTDEGNIPSDNLMCIKFSPGKAYVRGYDLEKTVTTIVDAKKPRETLDSQPQTVNLQLGNLLRVNNVFGVPKQNEVINLYSTRRASGSTPPSNTNLIGNARVYNFSLTDSKYVDSSTSWDLYLFDIQTFTKIEGQTQFPPLSQGVVIRGASSGAFGYITEGSLTPRSVIYLTDVSGVFLKGEKAIIEEENKVTEQLIKNTTSYSIDDIKSLYQSSSISGYAVDFLADTILEKRSVPGFTFSDIITIDDSEVATVPGKYFDKVKIGDIISYTTPDSNLIVYNTISDISSDKSTITLGSVESVPNVNVGSAQTSTTANKFSLAVPSIKNSEKNGLYITLSDRNISSVDLNSSNLIFSKQSLISKPTGSIGQITLSLTDFDVPDGSNFIAFDQERYSIHYNDGTIQPLTPEMFTYGSSTITIRNLLQNKTTDVISSTFEKPKILNKVKNNIRSEILEITLSSNQGSGSNSGTSINDGLTYNENYGLRIQDNEISLNYPDVNKVIAIYESLDSNSPILDSLSFSSILNIGDNAILGENIIGQSSGTVCRIVRVFANSVDVVYLNSNRFEENELVLFEESNISGEIDLISFGKYLNISNKYNLDKGQKDQFYDYSRIIRRSGENSPSKRLLVVFDRFSIDEADNGDLFTVLSYPETQYSEGIPSVGALNIRASDILDFRPRVSPFTGITSSPFYFSSRDFSSAIKLNVSPEESLQVYYSHYIGRIDKIYLNKDGEFLYLEGTSSDKPNSPSKNDDMMELATVELPPYLFNVDDAKIILKENKRYTMRDIGKIENRVENLERLTSLSLLELNTKTLEIQDSDGFNRFKSGFFVDDFSSLDRADLNYTLSEIGENGEGLGPTISRNTLQNYLAPSENISDEEIDLSIDYDLFDSNIVKKGESVLLKYESKKWIEQPLATQVENVNPFHVVAYRGLIQLNPERDNWTRTVQLPNVVINRSQTIELNNSVIVNGGTQTSRVANVRRRGDIESDIDIRTSTNVETSTQSTTTRSTQLVDSRSERFMRSRNTGFSASNLKPYTRYYQFLDGNSNVDFIPKLVEIAPTKSLSNFGSTSTFLVGETVNGYINGSKKISFRLASSNHKTGRFNNPKTKFNVNPYEKNSNISENYSNTSKTLNIDINSLCKEAQGKYSGFIRKGMKLVGQTSGAVAYVKNHRLVSDNYGDLYGSFFIRNPLKSPPPSVRINTGTKTYKLSSSKTNETPIPGSTTISTAEANYVSEGTVQLYQTTIINNQITTNTRTTTSTITRRVTEYYDPLAQSFSVGGSGTPNDDENGSYISGVDLFFYSKDQGNNPLTVQVRTVELGTPTRVILGNPVVLRPDEIVTSETGDKATHVEFDYPIYLAPGLEYCIVLLAPESTGYEVFIAEMGKKTLQTSNLPDSESVLYSQQFALGSLFKSQNGSIWTANQYQDMKFTLYRCEFNPNQSATAYFYNPTLDESNGYVPELEENPITTIPKRLRVGITTTNDPGLLAELVEGRKVSETSKDYVYGYIIKTGGPVEGVVNILDGGTGYSEGSITSTEVKTFSITGEGTGLELDLTISGGVVTGAVIANPGNGYSVDDVVGIVTSSISVPIGTGAKIRLTNVSEVDTLFLNGVQGDSFTTDGVSELVYYNSSNSRVVATNTLITESINIGEIFEGNYFNVSHFNHGMYAKNNRVEIYGVKSNSLPTTLVQSVTNSASSINVVNAEEFETFEGQLVSSTNPGYALVENELIKYESVNTSSNVLETVTRGEDSTIALAHDTGSSVVKYELEGVSLRRINTTHSIESFRLGIDDYFVAIDRSSNGVDRSIDDNVSSYPQLSFSSQLNCGGSEVHASENIQYDTVIPFYNIITPTGATSVSAKIRTITGTSISGNELSFQDNGYEDIQINSINKLDSIRIVCSKVNEQFFLSQLPRNKSFTTALLFETTNKYLSPQLFLDNCFTDFHAARINSPVTDYISDGRVNDFKNDPHTGNYTSNTIRLAQPATSLKVIISAYRHSSADFRVLYSLIKADSSEIDQSYQLFPGYDNLTVDADGDGYLDVIDESKNSGLPDTKVRASKPGEYLDYEFSVGNLPEFIGYKIKVVMSTKNQAFPPLFKDLRTLAVR